jgi:hypothetical protein
VALEQGGGTKESYLHTNRSDTLWLSVGNPLFAPEAVGGQARARLYWLEAECERLRGSEGRYSTAAGGCYGGGTINQLQVEYMMMDGVWCMVYGDDGRSWFKGPSGPPNKRVCTCRNDAELQLRFEKKIDCLQTPPKMIESTDAAWPCDM